MGDTTIVAVTMTEGECLATLIPNLNHISNKLPLSSSGYGGGGGGGGYDRGYDRGGGYSGSHRGGGGYDDRG